MLRPIASECVAPGSPHPAGTVAAAPPGGYLHYFALQCMSSGENQDMESQLTLRLSGALSRRLERSAKRLRRKRSDVVRLALEQFLDAEPDTRMVERVRDLLGAVESGVPDLGRRHREHLIRRLRRGE
jgi:predicted DNA-binding protein